MTRLQTTLESLGDLLLQPDLRTIAKHADRHLTRRHGASFDVDEDLHIAAAGATVHHADDVERERLLTGGVPRDSRNFKRIEFRHKLKRSQ